MEETIQDFINSEETIDFHFTLHSRFQRFMQENDYISVSKPLIDNQVVGYVRAADVERLKVALGVNRHYPYPSILGLLSRQSLDASGITQVRDQAHLDLDGTGVLVAFIDTGIDYVNPIFNYEDGTTRIKYIWDQTIPGNEPDGYYYGSEYGEAQINQAISSEDPYAIVPHRDTNGHGTFLASNACGSEIEEFVGVAPRANIISVKLRPARPYYRERYLVPDSIEDAFLTTDAILGLNYILDKAAELNMPVAICIGLGSTDGSHDGISALEDYVTKISLMDGVCVCTAAGNESQNGRHTNGTIPGPSGTQTVEFTVGEQVPGFYLNVWNSMSDLFVMTVRSPTGEEVNGALYRPGDIAGVNLLFEHTTVTMQYFYPTEESGSQLTFIRFISPTPGIWTLVLQCDTILNGSYHMWLPLYVLCPYDIRFLAPTPEYTVVMPGTARGGITCGAYSSISSSLYADSSWGPNRLGLVVPELVAPGVNVLGYSNSGLVAHSGTSVAASITTGACALLLEWAIVDGNDVAVSTFRIRSYLIRGCRRTNLLSFPNNQWGYGMLDLWGTFNILRRR